MAYFGLKKLQIKNRIELSIYFILSGLGTWTELNVVWGSTKSEAKDMYSSFEGVRAWEIAWGTLLDEI